MIIKTITRDEAKALYEKYVEYSAVPSAFLDKLDDDYLDIRKVLLTFEACLVEKEGYEFDLPFAMRIYDFFNAFDWFNETVASNYGFWRYICLCVVPDLILRRCGWNAKNFYEKTTRMYVPRLWWYVHMSFQGTSDYTEQVLLHLNTDFIMNLVERTGRSGFYLEVSREIMRTLSQLPKSVINQKINGANLFRRVLIQNTAKANNYNLVIENNAKEYVLSLFKACKVEVHDYE